MPGVRVLLAVVAVLFGTGCGYDDGRDLPGVVEGATPPDSRLVGACGGSPGLIESPSYTCTLFSPGEPRGVAIAVADALVDQGFEVSCRGGGVQIRLTGLRDDVRVDAETTGDGTVTTSGGVVNVFDPGYVPPGAEAIPPGSVALRLSASRQSDASASFYRSWISEGASCSTEGFRRLPTLDACIDGWNAPGNDTRRRLALRRARVPAASIVHLSDAPGVSNGCHFGFLARRGRYLMLEGRWRGDRLDWAEPELGYFSGEGFEPDARLRGDGMLVLVGRG
jgi:hypothetical protein